ncbi:MULTISPECIES: tetratricopeptide repeat protein [unclassified Sphingomonas]|uniref:tetratricopeptide repeat protein n=1 Tax=unclassified Sphingomonas TaxID=196159 RepID=UPI00082E7028|nr:MULTISPECIES: tetratricopeptide repeat protein [unclassified Sphingomonas]
MGWVALAVLALAAGALLWLCGAPRALTMILAAALVLGAAGYAWQGRPTLADSPRTAQARQLEMEPGLVAFRAAILGTRNRGAFSTADAAILAGRPDEAVAVLIRAVQRAPDDFAVWTALGTAYAINDNQQMSPAASFAFARAVRLAPREPGPPFFLGLALVNAGELEAARAAWARALALSPRDAPYRRDIEERVRLLDGFIGMMARPAPR